MNGCWFILLHTIQLKQQTNGKENLTKQRERIHTYTQNKRI